ncbi:TetR/AcrR family transcriptional regulator [uncultured Tateyamaria sp.]|uniref:TetR/AcrR family transcriptional regulator n=1 Tax=uncultured Tateyamaria sp. TaxID=455651 RepID=UPI002603EE57|nr:TetR/AcrR family transcriptional regulator [uncultured Tateyamaria sp.]
MTTARETEIMDFAEREMRKGGLDAFSFRDVAAAIGIKSASVHYHFPTKADLVQRVITRYADRFVGSLGAADAADETPHDRVARLADAYTGAYRQEGCSCLCTVLGSVVTYIPDGSPDKVRDFYNRLSQWLTTALEGKSTDLTPELVISILQGAMTLSVAVDRDAPIMDAKRYLLSVL